MIRKFLGSLKNRQDLTVSGNGLRSFSNNKIFLLLLVIILVVVSFVVIKQQGDKKLSPTTTIQTSQLKPAKDRVVINREFEFSLKDKSGIEVSKIKYTVESAELRKEILLKGKRASTIAGRIFLIINIKVANNFNKTIEINTKDYVRVIVEGNEAELLAADIHNDPVKIQPISTKYTRLGLPVDDTDKNFKLKVGEINGEKVDIEIKFK